MVYLWFSLVVYVGIIWCWFDYGIVGGVCLILVYAGVWIGCLLAYWFLYWLYVCCGELGVLVYGSVVDC